MQYTLLIHEDETVYGANKEGPAMQEMYAKHGAFVGDIGAAFVGGAGLKGTSSATTVRTSGGVKSIHDGPFAEAREQLGGYYVIEAPDLDAAIAIAKKVPVQDGGGVEIRPVFGPG